MKIYTVPFSAITMTNDADQDIWILGSGSSKPLIVHEWEVTSNMTTAEALTLRLMRRTTAGSGGTAQTIVPLDPGNTVSSGATLSTLATTPGTAGDIIKGFQWQQAGQPVGKLYTPETRILMVVSTYLALHLGTAVAASRTVSGYVTFEALG